MRATELIATVEAVGGRLALNGERLYYDLPEQAESLIEQIRARRDEIYRLLTERQQGPTPPAGVRILIWDLPAPPIAISNFSVVNDPDKFACYTLEQLGHALAGRDRLAGNWSVRELVERLEQVGVTVEVEQNESRNAFGKGDHDAA